MHFFHKVSHLNLQFTKFFFWFLFAGMNGVVNGVIGVLVNECAG